MLLPSVFTFTVGPVLHVEPLSHFSHNCLGKNKEQRLICFLFRIYMQKLICRITCLMIHLFFCHTGVAQQILSSRRSLLRADEQYSELKIECMLTRDKHNHDKQY